MKMSELQIGDIIRVDHSSIGTGAPGKVRPIVSYVVIQLHTGKLVAVAFDGNCNCDEHPSGWYSVSDYDELPMNTISVYRPTFFGTIFRGDYSNEEYYTRLV